MTNILRRWFGRKNRDETSVRDVGALVAPLAVPAVHIVTAERPGFSHFGGSPNLPSGIGWPTRDGNPLGFLARVSLSEIRGVHSFDWLPHSGALLFFYDMNEQPWGFDPKHRGSSAVLLVPDLQRAVHRTEVTATGQLGVLPHRNISFRRIDVFPSPERESVESLHLSHKEADVFCELADRVFQGKPKHQIGGFAAPVQGDDMELECQLVTNGLYCGNASGYEDSRAADLKPGVSNWRLLLQMDSDGDLDVMWGDGGVIYYWIEEHAARRGDFGNSWLILQCG